MTIQNWIYVTGTPRSATTFVGKILTVPVTVDYIHEPFNPDCGLPEIDQRHLYIRPGGMKAQSYQSLMERIFRYDFKLKTGFFRNDQPLKKWVKRVTGSRGPVYLRLAKLNLFHKAAVIKCPVGCFLTDYLSRTFSVKPVILFRHPLSFVASTIRLKWDRELSLSPLEAQSDLVEDYFSDEPDFLSKKWASNEELAAAYWRAVTKVLCLQAEKHPGWHTTTHEALSNEPVLKFKTMFKELGLTWSTRVEKAIIKRTNGGNKAEASKKKVQSFYRNSRKIFDLRLKMLDSDQRRRIFEITKDVALKIYSVKSFNL